MIVLQQEIIEVAVVTFVHSSSQISITNISGWMPFLPSAQVPGMVQ